MLNKLLFRLTSRLPCRIIELDSGPYLERYYVGCFKGVTFYLHRFVSSDSEDHIHNHPWRYALSVILTGGYVEEICHDIAPSAGPSGCVTYRRRVRWFNRVDGNRFHRIHDAKPGTWTLFMHSERIQGKGWGFLKQCGDVTVFVPHGSSPRRWWEEAVKGGEINREYIV